MVLAALGGRVGLLGYGWRHHVTHFLRGFEKVFRGSQAVLGHRVNAQGAGSVEWNSMRSISPVPGMPGASQPVRPTRGAVVTLNQSRSSALSSAVCRTRRAQD